MAGLINVYFILNDFFFRSKQPQIYKHAMLEVLSFE